MTGTDEHGQKVQEAAVKAGVTSQAYVDELSESFKDLVQVKGKYLQRRNCREVR